MVTLPLKVSRGIYLRCWENLAVLRAGQIRNDSNESAISKQLNATLRQARLCIARGSAPGAVIRCEVGAMSCYAGWSRCCDRVEAIVVCWTLGVRVGDAEMLS